MELIISPESGPLVPVSTAAEASDILWPALKTNIHIYMSLVAI